MELDRLRDLAARDGVERAKLVKRHEDRRVIMEQIEARQRAKLLEAEARGQESQAMRAMAKRSVEFTMLAVYDHYITAAVALCQCHMPASPQLAHRVAVCIMR